jgi:hypothetical protein
MQNDLRNVPDLKNCFQGASKLGSEVSDHVFSMYALLKESSEKQVVNHYSRLAIAQIGKPHDLVQVLGRSANLQYCGGNLDS